MLIFHNSHTAESLLDLEASGLLSASREHISSINQSPQDCCGRLPELQTISNNSLTPVRSTPAFPESDIPRMEPSSPSLFQNREKMTLPNLQTSLCLCIFYFLPISINPSFLKTCALSALCKLPWPLPPDCF